MLKYKYETHAHTSGLSRCGKISPRDLVRFYAELDYAGIFVTNHFGPDEDEAWSDRVELLYDHYKQAFEEGEKLGIDVFFGWEYSCSHTHDFLTYGLDEQWLYSHPEIAEMNTYEYLQFARKSGGFIIHAHPFRENNQAEICLRPHDVDAVEIINSGRSDDLNRFAKQYAENYNLPGFAGSDTHNNKKELFAGISFDRKVRNTQDFLTMFKNGEGELFCQKLR